MISLALRECLRLKTEEAYNERVGISYWPHIGELEYPECPAESGICTNSAKIIARRLGARVCGYPIFDHDSSNLVAYSAHGHDFCVIDGMIVDWWAWHVEESIKHPIIPIWDGVRRGLYKNPLHWNTWPQHDFRFQRR